MAKNNIFEVDVKGLRQLQEGKPKWFIVRELLQNAMDEDINICNITLNYERGKAHITVEDDSPIGFRDISDAYTLFKDTYKRSDVKKRGRFNFGEKQVLCLSDFARIVTTTGGLEFDVLGGERTTLRRKREKGSEVYVVVKMSRDEFNECCSYANDILVPKNIQIFLTIGQDKKELFNVAPHKIFTAKLLTEVKVDDRMKNVSRDTEVHLHTKSGTAYIFEMGIPICEIDCDYSIDIQQKVPMSNDRDNVDAKYLKLVYGEVLNQVYTEISKEQSSDLWVRTATTSDRIISEAVKDIVQKRFGEKALIANPMDRRSMDEAISNNFNVIYGSEMNKDEWNKVREFGILESTSSMFKTGIAEGRHLTRSEITTEQSRIANFAVRIAKEFLNLTITVGFYDSPDASVIADYNSEGQRLRFNVAHVEEGLWNLVAATGVNGMNLIQQPMLDLIIHELGHSAGWHYEHSYHECITMLGSKLTLKALTDPSWFKIA